MTVTCALTVVGLHAVMTVRGGTTKEVVLAYVQDVRCPLLRPGDKVLMDNLVAHKDPRVRDAIEGVGAKISSLPPYSLDLNPIELAWSWIKQWLKTAAARTEEAINHALSMAMDLITPGMAEGWIKHCGF